MQDRDAIDLVLGFCAAWDRRDAESVMGMLSVDCFFHNLPVAPLVGHDAIRPVVEGFFAIATEVAFDVTSAARAANGAVLIERVDRFTINGVQSELPVMGAFEIRDGKIAVWRDYYDQRQLDAMLAASGIGTASA